MMRHPSLLKGQLFLIDWAVDESIGVFSSNCGQSGIIFVIFRMWLLRTCATFAEDWWAFSGFDRRK
jgi:hypothetical protein